MILLSDITSVHWQLALGHPGVVEGAADIDQCIRIILSTPKGSIPHRLDFGSNIHLYIDYPFDQVIPHLVRESVEAIRQWEPRCILNRVVPKLQTLRDHKASLRLNDATYVEPSHIILHVEWQLSDGNDYQTIVSL